MPVAQGDRSVYYADEHRDDPERLLALNTEQDALGSVYEDARYAINDAAAAGAAAAAAQASADAAATLAGQSIRALVVYNFGQGSDRGWALVRQTGADDEYSTARRHTANAADPQTYIAGLSFAVIDTHIIAVRFKVLTCTTWEGRLRWSKQGGHDFDDVHYVEFPDPGRDVWRTLVIDLRGDADFMSGNTTGLRLDFGSSADTVVALDWICVGTTGQVAQSDVDAARDAADAAQDTADEAQADATEALAASAQASIDAAAAATAAANAHTEALARALADLSNVPDLLGAIQLVAESLSAISADVGVVTAGVLQNFTGSAKFDLNNSRIVFDNGVVVKVTGLGFGSTNQFIEWVGLRAGIVSGGVINLALCTTSNAIQYLTTAGDAYFSGTLAVGTLTTSGQTSDLSATAEITIGPFGSNGGPITVAYNLSMTGFSQGIISGDHSSDPPEVQSISYTIELQRAVGAGALATVATQTVNGSDTRTYGDYEAGVGTSWSRYAAVSGAFTYNDNLNSTDDRTYKLKITARTVYLINTQRLALTSQE